MRGTGSPKPGCGMASDKPCANHGPTSVVVMCYLVPVFINLGIAAQPSLPFVIR